MNITMKRENRGGKRKGSGRKPIFELGEKERCQVISDVNEKAKENGTSFGSVLGDIMFGKGGDKRTRLQAMRLYATDILPKISERDVTETKINGPAIFLPEDHPRLEVISGGKK